MMNNRTRPTSLRLPRVACFPLLAIVVLAGIPMGVINFAGVEPHERPIFSFDTTLMNPNNKTTISALAFLLPGFAFAFILLALIEFWLMQPQSPRQLQIDHFTQALVHLASGFLAQICVQQISATVAGKPRPNLLSVCKPSVSAVSALTAGGSSDMPWVLPTSITVADCTDTRDMDDYLKSFPSGHASSAVFLAGFPVMYLLYTLLVRREVMHVAGEQSRLAWDVRMAGLTCFNAVVFGLAWYVGVSRYIDNKHHIEDIVGGYLLGLTFAGMAVAECLIAQRAIAGQYTDGALAALGAALQRP